MRDPGTSSSIEEHHTPFSRTSTSQFFQQYTERSATEEQDTRGTPTDPQTPLPLSPLSSEPRHPLPPAALHSFHQCWLPFVSRVAYHSRYTEHPSLVTNELRMCLVHNLRQNVTSHSLALMFLGHWCRALFRPHFFVPAFIRRAFQYLAFACFGECSKYSRQHLKPSTSDRPGRSYTRLCGVSTTSAAMRQDFKTPRDLIQWTRESECHMTRGRSVRAFAPGTKHQRCAARDE